MIKQNVVLVVQQPFDRLLAKILYAPPLYLNYASLVIVLVLRAVVP